MASLRKGKVFFKDTLAGFIEETEEGYRFYYDQSYLSFSSAQPMRLIYLNGLFSTS